MYDIMTSLRYDGSFIFFQKVCLRVHVQDGGCALYLKLTHLSGVFFVIDRPCMHVLTTITRACRGGLMDFEF